ncbi:hypothetical protein BAUCODRAFT_122632 [Baudoinia panamericana UAMH 10762]|uniref:Uncharacterized protein n=1 Tax=Baudoinia panamericana (strain UAMH 10762) TaxID=717646 RepID=M2NBW1_BAUPA|nr:uncharacterized protein BAUCODRAFT_122632 [Baudoinia panamericana UAMH 10762]EMC96649.1 hypothetical protein BAUCODRAFT_122632 [Baudoinia panamericana UAMH 10762]
MQRVPTGVPSAKVQCGVASTPNGRGGRVTSGTSAPHYTANFLHKSSRSEEERLHGNRLALALDIDQHARMLAHSAPSNLSSACSSSTKINGRRVWRDGTWERLDPPVSPTKSATAKPPKEVPIIPFRVLDAPALRDDFYCSLLAYSPTLHCLAVGLGPHVYLWSENKCSSRPRIPDSLSAPFAAHVTSLSFSSLEGGSAILAIGRADGRITLWSPMDSEPRFDSEQPAPVSCVSFRPTTIRRPSVREAIISVLTEELLVGDEVGNVYIYSIEWPNQDARDLWAWHGSMTLLARMSCHTQQVCGMNWSPNGEVFATGGNDNLIYVFERKKLLNTRGGSSDTVVASPNTTVLSQTAVLCIGPGEQKHTFSLNAAVKALAFASWEPSLLAAGGGSNDRSIHFFHTSSGAALATIDCHAQVTSLLWSERRREIAATFGFAQPEHAVRIAVFAWPSCECLVKIPWWSEERALWAVRYPRGPSGAGEGKVDAEGRPWYGHRTKEEGCLVVATSDASIKFHEIWAEGNSNAEKQRAREPAGGLGSLAGSQILAGECTFGDGIR